MERLLRQTGVPGGLLFNGLALRLVSAPRGESSGWLDFRVADMVETAGRPISTALRLLLGQPRLLSLPRGQRLAALLQDSRRFQNEVSERLAEQVLHALYELLRGFQAAHDASKGELLRQPLAEHPDEVYRALEKLLVLDGERISYRALDVEEIGSVYQAMIGFRLETATGPSIAIRPQKKWAAPTTVDLEALLAEPRDRREKWLQERADRR